MKRISILPILLLISLFFIIICIYNQKNKKYTIEYTIEPLYDTTTIKTIYDNKDIRKILQLKEKQIQLQINNLEKILTKQTKLVNDLKKALE